MFRTRTEKRLIGAACLGLALGGNVSLGQVLWETGGHANCVTSLDVRADGLLASASWDSTVKIWDSADQTLIKTIEEFEQNSLTSVALSPTDPVVASAGASHNRVDLWSLDSGVLIRQLVGHVDQILTLAYSPDGTRLVSGGQDCRIRIWDSATGQLVMPALALPNHVYSVAVSPDNTLVACACGNGTIYVKYLADGSSAAQLAGHVGAVHSVAFSADGTYLASGGSDRTLRLWNVATWTQLWSNDTGAAVYTVAIDRNSPTLVLASGGAANTVQLWGTNGGLIQTLTGHTRPVRCLKFWTDSRLASCSDDKTILKWQTVTPYTRGSVTEFDTTVQLEYSPDGTALAAAGGGTIRVFDPGTGQELRSWPAHGVSRITALTWSPDGMWLASAATDCVVNVWEAQTGMLVQQFDNNGITVLSLDFSPDGWLVAAGDANFTIRVWSIWSGEPSPPMVVPGYPDMDYAWVYAVEFAPDGVKLVSGSKGVDQNLCLWNTNTCLLMRVFAGHRGDVWDVTLTADGSVLASASADASIRLWSMPSGTPIGLPMMPAQGRQVNAICFDSQEETLASASCDRFIRFWNVGTQTLAATHAIETRNVQFSIGISPDDSQFAFGRAEALVVADNPLEP